MPSSSFCRFLAKMKRWFPLSPETLKQKLADGNDAEDQMKKVYRHFVESPHARKQYRHFLTWY